MKTLSVYEHTINGSMEEAIDRLVTQVIIRTKEDLLKVVNLLNSQVTSNKENKTDKGKYIAYSIELNDVIVVDDFVNNFENILNDRNIIACSNQLEGSIRLKEW